MAEKYIRPPGPEDSVIIGLLEELEAIIADNTRHFDANSMTLASQIRANINQAIEHGDSENKLTSEISTLLSNLRNKSVKGHP